MNNGWRLSCLILAFLIILSALTACDDKKKSNVLFETTEKITTLDPQLASNELEKNLTANLFEGLFSLDGNGNAVKAIAADYKISDNGKKYIFTLSKDAKWQDGSDVTAKDFEYALKRAVDPKVKAPNSYMLRNIKNAKSIINGKSDNSALGVKALNTNTLEITLESPDTAFLEILACPISMPCNQAFLESTKGYYGLKKDCIISNGKYTLTAWNEKYATLSVNKDYYGANKNKYESLYVYFNTIDELAENINKNETDFTTLTYDFYCKIKTDDISKNIETVGNTVNILLASKNSNIANKNILKALMSNVEFDIKDKQMTELGISKIKTIIPSIISNDKKDIKDSTDKYKNTAAELFLTGCEELETGINFPTVTIAYQENTATKNVAKQIAKNWQITFGITVNIKAVDSVESLQADIDSNLSDFAIIPYSADNKLPAAFLEQFTSSPFLKGIGLDTKSLNSAVKSIRAADNTDKRNALCDDAAKTVINNLYITPLFESSKIFYFGDDFKERSNKFNYTVSF